MNQTVDTLVTEIGERFGNRVKQVANPCGEATFEVAPEDLVEVAFALRDEAPFKFEQLMDLAGVDYLAYGKTEWETHDATRTGFSRGRHEWADVEGDSSGSRFYVVYHLLSISRNHRLRLKVPCPDTEPPVIDSVYNVWNSANWFEREAFDLFGIIFNGHPDLRRILTDYGFVGHPFRKDFPLSGHVEVRYDPERGRVMYQPVSITPRVTVPKVIREDNQYEDALKDSGDA